jgi:hypothetical protein
MVRAGSSKQGAEARFEAGELRESWAARATRVGDDRARSGRDFGGETERAHGEVKQKRRHTALPINQTAALSSWNDELLPLTRIGTHRALISP